MRTSIPLSNIERNEFNPNVMSEEEFEALKEDMNDTGPEHALAIDPIIVSPKNVFYNDPKAEPGRYVIVDGEHRWRAATELEWNSISCEIRNVGEDLAKAMNYRRNKERGNLDPLREAVLFKAETDQEFTQEAVARKYNVSRSYVASRLTLIQIDETVVEVFRKPKESFKNLVISRYEKAHVEWEEKSQEPGLHWMNEPEKPDEEDLVPRGAISASHLEALPTLPKDKQVDIAYSILSRNLSVRETENMVKREKAKIARSRRFKEALVKAKRPKCPACGGDPDDFAYDDESKFKCGECRNRWEYMKTRKEVEAEAASRNKETHKEMVERLKEARENPRFIRLPETPEELHKKLKPWLLTKIHQLTEVERVRVYGKRGDDILEIDYQPPEQFQLMDMTFKVGDHTFGFKVQGKQYKVVDAKSRVDLDWNMKPTEENRESLRRFFEETVETNKDPIQGENR